MSRYLLDTDTVSDLIRNPQSRAAQRVAKVGENMVCTSIIVAAELRYGAAKKTAVRLTARVEAVLGVLEVLPWAAPADQAYAEIRTRLERTGKPIGGNDLLIAAQALALGCTVVTGNLRKFRRVAGLVCEDWR